MGCGTSKPGLTYEQKLKRWRELGGGDLEPVLASGAVALLDAQWIICLLYTSPSPRDRTRSRMPSSA